ncbi:guanine nucleotide exchange factor DBS-like [Thamnophis elegans]|uniref:guanine nucleotide exchange factor DBS-like n=1 Tax=Thamnophis elegans TaxID=35005 RepID=UPI0013778313|nr:guanine nucleotide exchange factor DBS-like [Thamnophis elegans]
MVPRSASQTGWPSKQMPSLDTFEDFEAIPSSTEDLSNSSDLEEDSHPSNGSNLYRVEGSFDTCFPDSLTLEEGDLVQFIQEGENGQWLVKKLVSEKTDWIPSSLLQPAESEANNSCRISNSDVYSDTHSSVSTNSEMKVELNRSLTAGQKAGS